MDSDLSEEVLGGSVTIPTLPSVVHRINRMLSDPDVGLREIGIEVAKDAPISTKVLRIANSAFYGLRERVLSTEHASCVLGLQVLKNIVMQASVIGQFEHLTNQHVFDLEGQWRHSILTAECSQMLARASRAKLGLKPEEFHTTGLLHDVGQVVLLDNMREKFLEAVQAAEDLDVELSSAEQEILGFDHAEIGSLVAKRWGLPEVLVGAIGNHHQPLDRLSVPAELVIGLANEVCESVPAGDKQSALAVLTPLLSERLKIDSNAFRAIVDQCLLRFPHIEV